jgi:hypothetical protein
MKFMSTHQLRKRARGFHGSATVVLNNDRKHDKSAASEERRGPPPPTHLSHTHTHSDFIHKDFSVNTEALQLTCTRNETANVGTMMHLN